RPRRQCARRRGFQRRRFRHRSSVGTRRRPDVVTGASGLVRVRAGPYQGWIVRASASEADSPDAGHGEGEPGPIQPNCANRLRPTDAGTAGIGTGTSHAPTWLLDTIAVATTDAGSIQASTPKTFTGFGSAAPAMASIPAVPGAALLQVIVNAALPTRGIDVTPIASGPVQPGLELPNTEAPVGSMSRPVTKMPHPPPLTVLTVPGVVGKPGPEWPPTMAFPCASRASATAYAPRLALLRNVE